MQPIFLCFLRQSILWRGDFVLCNSLVRQRRRVCVVTVTRWHYGSQPLEEHQQLSSATSLHCFCVLCFVLICVETFTRYLAAHFPAWLLFIVFILFHVFYSYFVIPASGFLVFSLWWLWWSSIASRSALQSFSICKSISLFKEYGHLLEHRLQHCETRRIKVDIWSDQAQSKVVEPAWLWYTYIILFLRCTRIRKETEIGQLQWQSSVH